MLREKNYPYHPYACNERLNFLSQRVKEYLQEKEAQEMLQHKGSHRTWPYSIHNRIRNMIYGYEGVRARMKSECLMVSKPYIPGILFWIQGAFCDQTLYVWFYQPLHTRNTKDYPKDDGNVLTDEEWMRIVWQQRRSVAWRSMEAKLCRSLQEFDWLLHMPSEPGDGLPPPYGYKGPRPSHTRMHPR